MESHKFGMALDVVGVRYELVFRFVSWVGVMSVTVLLICVRNALCASIQMQKTLH